MSNKLLTAVWERAPYYGGALLVYLALADQASDEGYCWPSQETIARKSRMNARNARKYLKQLEADGAVGVYRRGNGRTTTIYIVYAPDGLTPTPQDNTPPPETRGVAGDHPGGSQETTLKRGGSQETTLGGQSEPPTPVTEDPPGGSQETPRTPMEPIVIHQENQGASTDLKKADPEPEPEPEPPRGRWNEMQRWAREEGRLIVEPLRLEGDGFLRFTDLCAAYDRAHPEQMGWEAYSHQSADARHAQNNRLASTQGDPLALGASPAIMRAATG